MDEHHTSQEDESHRLREKVIYLEGELYVMANLYQALLARVTRRRMPRYDIKITYVIDSPARNPFTRWLKRYLENWLNAPRDYSRQRAIARTIHQRRRAN